MSRSLFTLTIVVACALTTHAGEAPPAESLHQTVDRLIEQQDFGPVAVPVDDAGFLRRATLSLAGRIPTRDELTSFLSDSAEDKRRKAVDRLLASDDFFRHMAVTFELILLERRGGSHVKTSEFRGYLEDAFRAKRSYLDIVCEVLSADGTKEKNRAASAFVLQRNVEPHVLTRDTGRILFGMDMQCAQCHDHPLIDDYRQDDYYGLNAFFVRSELFQPNNKQPALVAEKAAGEAVFKSVFTDREGNLRPRIPGGVELSEVKRKPHERYVVAPAKNVRPVPVESRLTKLAQTLRDEPSDQFDRNIANRLWAHMFGRGLVHPVDLHHSANPATHPEVLDLLAVEFRRHKHDVPWLLKEIALTKTWQRSYRLPTSSEHRSNVSEVAATLEKHSESLHEQAGEFDSRYETLLDDVDQKTADAKPAFDAELAAMKKIEEAMKPRDAAKAKFDAAESSASKSEKLLAALQESATRTATAAKLLNDDSLTKAVATLSDRAEKQKAALPKLKATLEAEQKKLAEAEAKLNEVASLADDAMSATASIDASIRQLRRDAYQQRLKAQALRTQAEANQRLSAELKTIADLIAKETLISELNRVSAEREQQIAELQRQRNTVNEQLTAARVAQQQATTVVQQVQARHAAILVRFNQVKSAHQSIQDAFESLSNVAGKLPELTETGEAVSSLENVLATVTEKTQEQQQAAADAEKALRTQQSHESSMRQQFEKVQEQFVDLTQRLQQLQRSQAEVVDNMGKAKAEHAMLKETVLDGSLDRFAAMRLTALTPEQLAWSILTATGEFERQKTAAAAKLNKAKPLSEEAKQDPAAVAQRENDIEAAARKTLDGTVTKFVTLYAASPGQPQDDFFATAEQSLFLANGGEIRGWLNPSGGNLIDRVKKLEVPQAVAQELYLCILSRNPTPEESADVAIYLADGADSKTTALQELAWGLLTSAEFRFQH